MMKLENNQQKNGKGKKDGIVLILEMMDKA